MPTEWKQIVSFVTMPFWHFPDHCVSCQEKFSWKIMFSKAPAARNKLYVCACLCMGPLWKHLTEQSPNTSSSVVCFCIFFTSAAHSVGTDYYWFCHTKQNMKEFSFNTNGCKINKMKKKKKFSKKVELYFTFIPQPSESVSRKVVRRT